MQINIDELIRTSHLERRRLIYSEWLTESEDDRKLRDIARRYCVRCDTYDETVCTGRHPKTGAAVPMTPREQGLINSHARESHQLAVQQAYNIGFTEEQVVQAIRDEYRSQS